MPEPKLRYYLHSKVASTGHRPIFLSVGVGETRPVRQATGYTAHPAYFAPSAPHLRKGADGYRTINEKLDELRLARLTTAALSRGTRASSRRPWSAWPASPW
jgi:hypothetical protein